MARRACRLTGVLFLIVAIQTEARPQRGKGHVESSARRTIAAYDRDILTMSDDQIVFPTDAPDYKLGPVPECHSAGYCEKPSYYPESYIRAAIRRHENLKYLAGVDVIADVVQRIDVTDDVPLCSSTEQVIYPKTAQNRQKEWLFIVNQENFTQGVRIEKCSNEDSPCNLINDVPEGYKTMCKQKHIYRQLAAISTDGSINAEVFAFPSSCCCHVKFVGNPLTRMGLSVNANQSPARKKLD